MLFEHCAVKLLEKFNRFKIFSSAVFIRNPFAVLTSVIEIKHWCNCVNPKPVKMEIVNPIHCRGNKERFNLIFAVVKYSCAPFLMLAFSHIGVFVCAFSVKFIKTVSVFREVSRYPVKYYSDSGFVASVNKIHKVVRCSVAWSRSKVSCNLISPWAVKRIFHNRHHFNMSVSHIFYVRHKFLCHLPVW